MSSIYEKLMKGFSDELDRIKQPKKHPEPSETSLEVQKTNDTFDPEVANAMSVLYNKGLTLDQIQKMIKEFCPVCRGKKELRTIFDTTIKCWCSLKKEKK